MDGDTGDYTKDEYDKVKQLSSPIMEDSDFLIGYFYLDWELEDDDL